MANAMAMIRLYGKEVSFDFEIPDEQIEGMTPDQLNAHIHSRAVIEAMKHDWFDLRVGLYTESEGPSLDDIDFDDRITHAGYGGTC